MGNLNFNKISIIIAIFAISAFVVSLLPILFYYFTFKDNAISKIPSDWGTFGDFLSGTSGIVLSFLAVIFSLVSIYLTIRIAKYIQDNEFKYKDAQSKNDLQLIYTQSKPFPYIDLGKLPNETYVTLQNMGLGPLIIKEISIIYKKNTQFENFFQLLSTELHISDYS